MRDDGPRTLFKVRTSKRVVRESWQLGTILLGLCLGLAAFAGLHVLACKHRHPGRTAAECLLPKGKR